MPTGTLLTISGYNFVPNSTVGWVLASNPTANPTNVTTPTTITQTQITLTVPTLTNKPGPTTVYIPVVEDPSGYSSLESQPYLESADEFTYP